MGARARHDKSISQSLNSLTTHTPWMIASWIASWPNANGFFVVRFASLPLVRRTDRPRLLALTELSPVGAGLPPDS